MVFTALILSRFMRRSGWSFLVAFRVFVAFIGHWGWTLVFFIAFVLFMGRWGWKFVVFTAFVAFYFSPSPEPVLSELGFQLGGPFGLAWGLMAGGRGFASHGGITLSRGWLCQKLKPRDIPGTHLHLVTQLLICSQHYFFPGCSCFFAYCGEKENCKHWYLSQGLFVFCLLCNSIDIILMDVKAFSQVI